MAVEITKPWNEGTEDSDSEVSAKGIFQSKDSHSDEFGSDTTQADMVPGGDGAKGNGWNLLNSANADAIDIDTTVAGALFFDLNGNSTTWRDAVFSGPFLYKEILETRDFDINTSFDLSDGDANFEGGGLFVRSPDTGGGENWVGIFNTFNITQLVADTTVNGTTTDTVINSNTDRFYRINKTGTVYTIYSRATEFNPDSSAFAWTQRAQYTRGDFTGTLQVGVSFRTANTADNFEGNVVYFRDIIPYSTSALTIETDAYTTDEAIASDDIHAKLGRTPLAATEIKMYVKEDAGAFSAGINVDVTPIVGETGWFKFAAGTTFSSHSTITLKPELNSPDTATQLQVLVLKVKDVTIAGGGGGIVGRQIF